MSDQTNPRGVTAPPVHVMFVAVLADGGVVSYELPTESQDTAEVTFSSSTEVEEKGWGDRRAPVVHGRTVELTAKVTYRQPLADRPGGLYRVGVHGGAEPSAEIPGRQVPQHVVAMLAQTIGWSPAGDMPRDSTTWAKAVQGQATLVGQRIWQEAWLSGMMSAERLGMLPQKVVVSDPQFGAAPIKMPLLAGDGSVTWMPATCPAGMADRGECGRPVEAIEPFPAALTTGTKRQVIVRPCGHTMWLPDPVEVTAK